MGSTGFQNFDGAVAIVTGGSSGIGQGIAQALVARGAQVIIVSNDEARLGRTAAKIGAVPMVADVADRHAMLQLASDVMAKYGTVNIVCNNAGVGPVAAIKDLTYDDWRWMVGVNLWGVIHGIEAFLPHLLDAPRGGQIVNTASLAGLWPVAKLGSYSATKAAVVAMTEALHLELQASDAQVGATVLCPGPVQTEIKSSLRNRQGTGALEDIDIANIFPPKIIRTPAQIALQVIDAIEHNHLYILTHPELSGALDLRHQKLVAAFEHAGTWTRTGQDGNATG